jgi:hypothetical protein
MTEVWSTILWLLAPAICRATVVRRPTLGPIARAAAPPRPHRTGGRRRGAFARAAADTDSHGRMDHPNKRLTANG